MEEQDYILFEEYLSEKLSEKDRLDFEKRLSTDQDFYQSFKIYKESVAFLNSKFNNEQESKEFEKNLKSISEKYFEEKETPQRKIMFKPWKWGVAAGVAIAILFFANQFGGAPTYTDYAKYPEISFSVRGHEDALAIEAENAFNQKYYAVASEAFKKLLKENPNQVDYQLYYAVTLVELNYFDEADAIFGKIISSPSAYQNEARWYASLSKLKQKKNQEVVTLLKQIPISAQEYSQARKLLKKLE